MAIAGALLAVVLMVAYIWNEFQKRKQKTGDHKPLSERPTAKRLFRNARVKRNNSTGSNSSTGSRSSNGSRSNSVDIEEWDVIVVGAGVAGGAMGAAISRNYLSGGWTKQREMRVLILERSLAEPNRIVGELLQPGGKDQLMKMNISDALDGFDAQIIKGYVMIKGDKQLQIAYPEAGASDGDADGDEAGEKLVKLATGVGLHNGRFLTKLRELCRTSPAVTLRQGTVTQLLRSGEDCVTGVVYRSDCGDTLEARAPLTVVADGCFSILRKPLHRAKFNVTSHFLGLLLENCPLPAENHGHCLLTDPSPVLVYPVSSTEARMLIDFPDHIPDMKNGDLDRHLRKNLLPQLPECIKPSFLAALDKKTSLQSMPNRTLSALPYRTPGVVMLGDSLNMRHPLTGGGMTVALTDVNKLLAALEQQPQGASPGSVEDAFYASRTQDNTAINILADALYQVFRVESEELREACFSYLSLGGTFAQGPITLLAGMTRDSSLLLKHFFAVALYGASRALLPLPTPSKIASAFKMGRDALRIIMPLIGRESEARGNAAVALACESVSAVVA